MARVMKLAFFVQHAGASAGTPGDRQNTVRLALTPKSEKLDDENKAVFPDAARKNGSIELTGMTDELQAAYKAGKRVMVTFDVEA